MSREAGWAPKLLPSRGGVSSWKSPGSTFGNGRWPNASHQSAKPSFVIKMGLTNETDQIRTVDQP
jgi:hypothetical protein